MKRKKKWKIWGAVLGLLLFAGGLAGGYLYHLYHLPALKILNASKGKILDSGRIEVQAGILFKSRNMILSYESDLKDRYLAGVYEEKDRRTVAILDDNKIKIEDSQGENRTSFQNDLWVDQDLLFEGLEELKNKKLEKVDYQKVLKCLPRDKIKKVFRKDVKKFIVRAFLALEKNSRKRLGFTKEEDTYKFNFQLQDLGDVILPLCKNYMEEEAYEKIRDFIYDNRSIRVKLALKLEGDQITDIDLRITEKVVIKVHYSDLGETKLTIDEEKDLH